MNYETVPLERVATLLSGGTPSKSKPEYWAGDIPWLTPKDMAQWVGKTDDAVSAKAIGNGTRLAPPHTSFVAVRGMSLHTEIRIVRSERPLTFNQDIKAVVANEEVDPTFLYYALTARRQQLLDWVSAAGHGTGVLATDRLKSVPIPDLGLRDQRALATILSVLDDKIELNRRMNETLEAMAQAIFRDWFVDFGPVRRKLAGAIDPVDIMGGITHDLGRARELVSLFPAQLNDDDLPSGWRYGAARDLLEFNPREQLRAGTPAPYSDMSSLPTRGTVAEPPITRPFGSGMRFRNGDALLARITPCLENGKGAWVDFLTDDAPVGWGSTEFIVMRGLPETPSPFGYLLSRDPDFRQHAIQSMTGTSGRQRAQADSLENWPMAVPPAPVLQAFGGYVVPLFTRITAAAAENRTLAETRDYLLPRLMSGDVSVQEAAQNLGAAA